MEPESSLRMALIRNGLFLFYLFLLSIPSVKAGFTFVLTDVDLLDEDRYEAIESIVLIDQCSLRVSAMKTRVSRSVDVIYFMDEERMIFVNHKTRSYSVFSREWLESFKGQVSSLVSDFETGIPNESGLSKRELKKLRDRWQKRNESIGKDFFEERDAEEEKEIGGRLARRIDLLNKGVLDRKVWVSSFDALKLGDCMADLFKGMASFHRDIRTVGALVGSGVGVRLDAGSNWVEQIERFEGIPVLIDFFDSNGSHSRRITLESIQEVEATPEDFAPPEEYINESMEEYGGVRGGDDG